VLRNGDRYDESLAAEIDGAFARLINCTDAKLHLSMVEIRNET
jgi:hypothetical protein